jgi:membrane protein
MLFFFFVFSNQYYDQFWSNYHSICVIFKVLPDANIRWKDVRTGVFLRPVYLCWVFLIGLYIDISGTGSAYGPAGSLIVILVWVLHTAAILYFGAQFTKTYAEYTGELNQLIMPFMWSNLKRKIEKCCLIPKHPILK